MIIINIEQILLIYATELYGIRILSLFIKSTFFRTRAGQQNCKRKRERERKLNRKQLIRWGSAVYADDARR